MTIAPWDFWWWANMAIRMRHFSWSWRVRKRKFQWLRTCRAMPSICSNQPGALLFKDLKTSPSWLLSKIFEDNSFHHICYAAPDIWSRWFWPSAAFGQRWIPWENIDSFVSSFSGGPAANWNKPKVDQQLKRIQQVLLYFFIWVFPKIGVPQNGWFIMEQSLSKWMIWGENAPIKRKHPYSPNVISLLFHEHFEVWILEVEIWNWSV